MSLSTEQLGELQHLISRLCDDALSDEELQRLAAWLERDTDALAIYVQFLEVHTSLAWSQSPWGSAAPGPVAGAGKAAAATNAKYRPLVRLAEFFARPTPLSISVAALVMGVLITAMAFMTPPVYRALTRAVPPEDAAQYQIVAELTGMHEAVWAEGQIGASRGAFLALGHRIYLQQGLVEVTFSSGAKLVIEGPAELQMDGRNRCTLATGKVVGQVPAAAIGFSVTTPDFEVVDLGTEFGVGVADGKASIQVFEGAVAYLPKSQPAAQGERRVITAGEGVTIDSSGRVQPLAKSTAQMFRRQLPSAEQPIDVTPRFVVEKNCSRLMYAGIGQATEDGLFSVYDAASGVRAGNQFVWLDLSDSLSQLPAGHVERVSLRWEGLVAPTLVRGHGGKPTVQSEMGVFPAPDDWRGVPSVFVRADGENNVNFYAAHADEVVATAVVPAVNEEQKFVATWDITPLVQHWMDNPKAPRRGQLIIVNGQHPVSVVWNRGFPRVYAQTRPANAEGVKDSDVSEPPQAAP